uniref:Uncharacterized protein n=1 Tax=Avena sativa TaxID=4498 RepID=A0ACD5TS73_AVESA
MAGQVSEKELGTVLMQAMQAQKNLRPQRDRLLQLRRRLEHLSLSPVEADAGHADKIKQLANDLFKVYFIGIEYGSRTLGTCLMLSAKAGARLALNLAFATMPDERLHDALLAQRLPARRTTQTEAFSRVEATFNAVKVVQDHHVPRCIEHLVGQRPPTVVDAYNENPKKTDRSDPAPDTVVDLAKARDFLDRACTLADLADLAVNTAGSMFLRALGKVGDMGP